MPAFLLSKMNKLTPIVKENLSPGMILMGIQEDYRGNYLRIIIDAEVPVTLEETTDLSLRLRNSKTFESFFPNGFRLEVTTPGLDKPLLYPFQYRKNRNRLLKVEFYEDDKLTTITGKILQADEEKIQLEYNSNVIDVSYDKIKSAKVKISFK